MAPQVLRQEGLFRHPPGEQHPSHDPSIQLISTVFAATPSTLDWKDLMTEELLVLPPSAGAPSKEQRIRHMLENAPGWSFIQSPRGEEAVEVTLKKPQLQAATSGLVCTSVHTPVESSTDMFTLVGADFSNLVDPLADTLLDPFGPLDDSCLPTSNEPPSPHTVDTEQFVEAAPSRVSAPEQSLHQAQPLRDPAPEPSLHQVLAALEQPTEAQQPTRFRRS
jgi:hypothetical protein